MPGFNFFYNIPSITIERNKNLLTDTISGPKFEVNRFTLNKFIHDKLFIEKDGIVLVIEGIILNKAELLAKYKYSSWGDLVYRLYKQSDEFFNEFRGSFSGLVYNKKEDKAIIFTDQLGTKHLYYYIVSNLIFVTSEISDIYTYFKEKNIEYELDVKAAYDLLSYGYMVADNTLCNKIKKFNPGTYIEIKDSRIKNIEYYKLPLSAKKISIDEQEIIDVLDEKFRNAIKLQFDKDKEYSYKHFVGLSGGLDSRMTSWVAHDMGYIDQINFTFSQSDYLDETIPKKIAADLKHEWVFKALDNGIFLKDLEEINVMTGGGVLYYGLAHGNSMMKLINFNDLGIVHSGQLGDIVIGTFIKSLSISSLNKMHGAYSKVLLNNNINVSDDTFESIENKLIYQRGINGANCGLLGVQNYSETVSPFYDIDFFEFCLSIPIKLRLGHNLYKKWILAKYPQAAEYVWESTKQKITKKNITIRFRGKHISLTKILPLILYKVGVNKSSIQTKNHMNPLDYWYSTNYNIKAFQNKYFEENLTLVIDTELRNVCNRLFNEGGAVEKNQVLSLLAAIKIFFK